MFEKIANVILKSNTTLSYIEMAHFPKKSNLKKAKNALENANFTKINKTVFKMQ
jgi:hypothetical protein